MRNRTRGKTRRETVVKRAILSGHPSFHWRFSRDALGVHGMSTDRKGNLCVAEVDAGRFQKFHPREGANPAYLIGKPIYSGLAVKKQRHNQLAFRCASVPCEGFAQCALARLRFARPSPNPLGAVAERWDLRG
jgi:hypothetical protein